MASHSNPRRDILDCIQALTTQRRIYLRHLADILCAKIGGIGKVALHCLFIITRKWKTVATSSYEVQK